MVEALIDHRFKLARNMLGASDTTFSSVAKHLGVARSTLYRLLGASPNETGAEVRVGWAFPPGLAA